jgi:3-oxoacyl-[acyl-carrier-protein] synthase II
MDIFIQYAIAASQFAMDDSGFVITRELGPRVGVFIASGIGGFTTIEREHKALLEGGPRKISPCSSFLGDHQPAAGQVSIRYGAKDPTPPPAPRAPPRRTRSATPSRSSGAATRT